MINYYKGGDAVMEKGIRFYDGIVEKWLHIQ